MIGPPAVVVAVVVEMEGFGLGFALMWEAAEMGVGVAVGAGMESFTSFLSDLFTMVHCGIAIEVLGILFVKD